MSTAVAFAIGALTGVALVVIGVAFLALRERPAASDFLADPDDWGAR